MSAWDWIKCYLGIGNGEIKEDDIRNDVDDDDDDSNADIITLTTEDGKENDFYEIAGIAHQGNFYLILQPVELLEGMDDDEAFVFKLTRKENGEESYDLEKDDAIVDAVFEEYNRLLDEQEK